MQFREFQIVEHTKRNVCMHVNQFGQRVTVMNQGKLEQCDTPEKLIKNPRTSFVAYFTHRSKGLAEKNTQKIAKGADAEFER